MCTIGRRRLYASTSREGKSIERLSISTSIVWEDTANLIRRVRSVLADDVDPFARTIVGEIETERHIIVSFIEGIDCGLIYR